jgi:hypothetical protein
VDFFNKCTEIPLQQAVVSQKNKNNGRKIKLCLAGKSYHH